MLYANSICYLICILPFLNSFFWMKMQTSQSIQCKVSQVFKVTLLKEFTKFANSSFSDHPFLCIYYYAMYVNNINTRNPQLLIQHPFYLLFLGCFLSFYRETLGISHSSYSLWPSATKNLQGNLTRFWVWIGNYLQLKFSAVSLQPEN